MYFKTAYCSAKVIRIRDGMKYPPEVVAVQTQIHRVYVLNVVQCALMTLLAVHYDMSPEDRHFLWAVWGTSLAAMTVYGGYLLAALSDILIKVIDTAIGSFQVKGSITVGKNTSKTTGSKISPSGVIEPALEGMEGAPTSPNPTNPTACAKEGAADDVQNDKDAKRRNKVSHLLHLKSVWRLSKLIIAYNAVPNVVIYNLLFWLPLADILRPYLMYNMGMVSVLVFVPFAYILKLDD